MNKKTLLVLGVVVAAVAVYVYMNKQRGNSA